MSLMSMTTGIIQWIISSIIVMGVVNINLHQVKTGIMMQAQGIITPELNPITSFIVYKYSISLNDKISYLRSNT